MPTHIELRQSRAVFESAFDFVFDFVFDLDFDFVFDLDFDSVFESNSHVALPLVLGRKWIRKVRV